MKTWTELFSQKEFYQRPGVRYNEHVSTYHLFYGTADVRKVSFNVLQKDGNMVDKIVSSNLVECDGGERSNTYVGEFSGEHIFACGWIVSDVHLRSQWQIKIKKRSFTPF